ncbi:MAG TPA: hypothetical protein VGV39_11680 [Mesorhizobium sp.]|jgi:hypothetical protein|uniref:hypothetical protein n=1 Tax=Mesorhizobium sp. TaxID=1871066 RepID=UPI002DDD17D3|nr:hypothetical protein [Mesorhizobium sp.]HEV2503730.1 hypothetical protein [Mesorhizobium sp.]
MRSEPKFTEAVAHYCETMIEPSPSAWPLRKLLNQFDRYYAAYMLIWNYYGWVEEGAPSPTLARLKTVSGLSPRQLTSFVTVLRQAELVAAEPEAGNRRRSILRPQAELIREISRSCVAFLTAHDHVHAGTLAGIASASTDRLGRMIWGSARQVLSSGTVIAPYPTVLAMAGYDGGYPVLTAIMADHYRRIKGHGGVALGYAALAERFQVSRSHVGNVIGWLHKNGAIDEDRAARPVLVDEFEQWSMSEMQHYARLVTSLFPSG